MGTWIRLAMVERHLGLVPCAELDDALSRVRVIGDIVGATLYQSGRFGRDDGLRDWDRNRDLREDRREIRDDERRLARAQVPPLELSGVEIGPARTLGNDYGEVLVSISFAARIDQLLNLLAEDVYVTIDLDVFDPSEMPALGTPEPGGLQARELLKSIRRLATDHLCGYTGGQDDRIRPG